MPEISIRGSAAVIVAVILAVMPAAAAPEKTEETVHPFSISISSALSNEVDNSSSVMNAMTTIDYTWSVKQDIRTLSINSIKVNATLDGKPVSNMTMNREKMTTVTTGRTNVFSVENAPDALKNQLTESFDTPLCELKVDSNGREISRKSLAGRSATPMIENGMLANSMILHPPFYRDRNEWKSNVEISMGNGNFATGELTYTKVPGAKKGQAVKVSGTVQNNDTTIQGKKMRVRAHYKISGEQTFDPEIREWISGKLLSDISLKMTVEGKVTLAKGVMTLTLEKKDNKDSNPPIPDKK